MDVLGAGLVDLDGFRLNAVGYSEFGRRERREGAEEKEVGKRGSIARQKKVLFAVNSPFK